MGAPSLELIRLFLHVTAASIWVGGQLVLAALVPALRRHSPATPAVAARAFGRVAWPAFAVLLATGAWNAVAVRHELHGAHAVLFAAKLFAVVGSGAAAWLHVRATGARGRAVSGACAGLFALVALWLGVQLTL